MPASVRHPPWSPDGRAQCRSPSPAPRRAGSITQPRRTATRTKTTNPPSRGQYMALKHIGCAGGERRAIRRVEPPARWARGTPKQPASAVPDGTRSASGRAAATRLGGPAERSGRPHQWPMRTADAHEKSSSRSLPLPLRCDRSPYRDLTSVRLSLRLTCPCIKAITAPLRNRQLRKTGEIPPGANLGKVRAVCADELPALAISVALWE